MNYLELKNSHAEELNNFPNAFAFSKSQFDEAMVNLGLTPSDTDKVCTVFGGGIIKKTDSKALNELFNRHHSERKGAMKSSDDYLVEMFSYELANHEYGYTMELDSTLEALSLTIEEVNADKRLLKALHTAISQVNFD